MLYSCAQAWRSVQSQRGVVTGILRDDPGRVEGVRCRLAGSETEVSYRARVVVGCDGSQSVVRRALGIWAVQEPYDHEQVIIAANGQAELPAALHWYLDDIGALCVVSRPRQQARILLTLPIGARGDLLKQPDPALHDYVAARFPILSHLDIVKANAYVYRLARHVADSFWSPGAALVGDSAHATHPAGATGMSLAISGAARFAARLVPVLQAGANAAIDEQLQAYDTERRPAALQAVAANHNQALRIWQSELFRDPDAYAAAIDPHSGWGAVGAGWGEDPAALKAS